MGPPGDATKSCAADIDAQRCRIYRGAGVSDDDEGILLLEPGSTVVTGSGAAIGAPEGALDAELEIEVELIDDPSINTPMPENWSASGMEIVGDFYAVSGS